MRGGEGEDGGVGRNEGESVSTLLGLYFCMREAQHGPRNVYVGYCR